MSVDYLTIVVVAFGWLVLHCLAIQRANTAKRKELVLEYLVSVFRDLSNEVAYREKSPERDKKLENSLSEIQIFGTIEQVSLAKSLADNLASDGVSEIAPLINNLRDSLRKELGLDAVSENISWLRLQKKHGNGT